MSQALLLLIARQDLSSTDMITAVDRDYRSRDESTTGPTQKAYDLGKIIGLAKAARRCSLYNRSSGDILIRSVPAHCGLNPAGQDRIDANIWPPSDGKGFCELHDSALAGRICGDDAATEKRIHRADRYDRSPRLV